MRNGINEFMQDLRDLEAKFEAYLIDVQYESAFWALRQVVQQTPVWEPREKDPKGYSKHVGGVAKNAWHISIENPSDAGPRAPDKDGKGSKNDGKRFLKKMRTFKEIWFTNNVPYITVLEFGGYPNPPERGTDRTVGGYSKQAPAGMARKALRELPAAHEIIAKQLFVEHFGL